MPAASPAVSTLTVRSCGAVPEPGVTDIHGASSEVVKDSDPVPELVTLSVLSAGFAPPATALNDRLAGATESAGVTGGGSTVKVTGTSVGEPVAPAEVTVTLPV